MAHRNGQEESRWESGAFLEPFLPGCSVVQSAVDTAPQSCSSRSHWEWPFVDGACDRCQPRENPIPQGPPGLLLKSE